jgi:DNA invertase Pin-like site-specific DNA recombinase
MKLGYVRVSTKEQNEARQLEALKPYNIEQLYEEKVSGKDTNRPQLKALQEFARKGDTIYIESISRLARNTLDFLNIVEQFTAKGVHLISLKENIDTSTPQGNFMLSVFAALSQLERDTIKQRQREGIDIALAEGKAYGRPKVEVDEKVFRKVYRQYKEQGLTVVQAAKLLGVTRQVFYRRIKELESSVSR